MQYWPPLGLQVMLLVPLGELRHGQVRVQPVDHWGLEVFEEEAVAEAVYYVWANAATGQHQVNDILGQKSAYSHVSGMIVIRNNSL